MQGFPDGVVVIAHRGASAYAPEHSFAAYDLALALGADRLELDVRALADGTLAVLHDRTLLRTAGDPRAVCALRAADLDALPADRRPLRLGEVFERYGRHARYWVELKDPVPRDLPRLLATVAAHRVRRNVSVQSFDHAALRLLRAIGPGVPLAALYRHAASPRAIVRELGRTRAWAQAIAPCCSSVDRRLVAAAHAHGVAVHPYTVNDESEVERLVALGADAIITDAPDRVRAVLAATPGRAAA